MGNCTGKCISHLVDNIGPTLHQNLNDLVGVHPSSNAAIHDSLPPSYEKHHVIKVYDGDTLTLRNNDRVRLIGIDTPEIKPSQPFAKEAKKFLSDKVLGQEIFLSFETDGDKKDHYGRWVAWIFVKEGDKFLNLNEGLVAAGFASVYNPGKNKLHNQREMITMQKVARESKGGKWIDFSDSEVLKTRNGRCFHRHRGCTHLSKSRNLITIMQSDALDNGLSACRGCYE
eukprot:scaffold10038_cov267-Chaetoceros_neogracile.AAC.10